MRGGFLRESAWCGVSRGALRRVPHSGSSRARLDLHGHARLRRWGRFVQAADDLDTAARGIDDGAHAEDDRRLFEVWVVGSGELKSRAARESSHGRLRHSEEDAQRRLRREILFSPPAHHGAAAYHAIERSCDAGLARFHICGMQLTFGGKLIRFVAGHLGLGSVTYCTCSQSSSSSIFRAHGIGSA